MAATETFRVPAAQATDRGEPWDALHVFIHDFQEIGRYLQTCVAAMPQALRADSFFIRYWYGGPHLRWRFRGPARRAAVQQCLEDGLAGVFVATPLNPITYYRVYAPYLATEVSGEAPLPWFPSGSVQAIPYEPELERYGGHAGLALAESHFVWDSAEALRMLATHSPRDEPALERLMLGYCFEYVEAWSRSSGCTLMEAASAVLQVRLMPSGEDLSWLSAAGLSQNALQRIQKAWREGSHLAASLKPVRAELERMVRQRAACKVQGTAGILSSLLHMAFNRRGIAPRREQTIRRCASLTLTDPGSPCNVPR